MSRAVRWSESPDHCRWTINVFNVWDRANHPHINASQAHAANLPFHVGFERTAIFNPIASIERIVG
ncbi:hypothetical protein IQ287_14600 [Burkholderia sp. R-69927]|uniref:hypothetical protein n=1 Tax=Paraburkholderia domus TaxID=2793075 RepID=UPI001912FC0C|nr:hypothetical protein [Paraburkholderia domus]MBK5087220.1 hypothetical protein [Burkholderia sp. R-69927]